MNLGKGELPTALQFFSNAERSGKLELDCTGIAKRGSIYYDRGDIVHAECDDEFKGVEAIARLIICHAVTAHFEHSESPPERELMLNTDQLLMEATVIADHNNSDWEKEYEEIVAKRRIWKHPIWRTLPIAIGSAVLVYMLFIMIFFAWVKSQHKSVEIKLAHSLEQMKSRYSEQKTEQIQTLMANYRFNAAEDLLIKTFELVPDDKKLKSLLRICRNKETTPGEAGTALHEAKQLIEDAKNIESGQGVEAKRNALFDLYKTARNLIENREFGGGKTAVNKLKKQYQELVEYDRNRTLVYKVRESTLTTKHTLRTKQNNIEQKTTWKRALILELKAEDAFESGQFEEALQLWKLTEAEFNKAALS